MRVELVLSSSALLGLLDWSCLLGRLGFVPIAGQSDGSLLLVIY
ncbi:unnamed protein product [Arabidopsis lyrata]|nr:unnamed protein product [Arabidopsis lyrata]